MAYVVRRPGGRWEIRESYVSACGPRARTLVTFRALSPALLERARRAAHRPIEAERLVRAARRAGVPFEPAPGDALAQSLLRGIVRGEKVRPGLRALLLNCLGGAPVRSVDEALAEWIGASSEERAAALVDLLGLADRLPRPRRGSLRFPGLSPSRSRR